MTGRSESGDSLEYVEGSAPHMRADGNAPEATEVVTAGGDPSVISL
jgi:hypothetical protein